MSDKKRKIEIWPVAIVVVLSCFIGGIVFSVSLMLQQEVPLVAEDYYAQELVFQERIDQNARAVGAGALPTLVRDIENPGAWLAFPRSGLVDVGAGQIAFVRPSNPQLDFTVPVNPDSEGRQFIGLNEVQKGLWLVQLDWEEEGKRFYHETQLLLGK